MVVRRLLGLFNRMPYKRAGYRSAYLNQLFFESWRKVVRSLLGFSQPTSLHMYRVPDGRRFDLRQDFLLYVYFFIYMYVYVCV